MSRPCAAANASACSMSTFAPRNAADVHSVGSTRAPRRSASSSLVFCSRAPLRSARRSTALRRSALTRPASRSRQSERSTPRRSDAPSTVSVKSTSTSLIGRIRHSVNTDPRKLQWRNVLCSKDVRRNLQLRKAEPSCSDSDKSTPLKSHSVNTTRSVRIRLRSSSRKSWWSNSRSVQTVSSSLTRSAARWREAVQRVLGDGDQRGLGGVAVAGVDGDDRDVLAQRQRLADRMSGMPWRPVEFVNRDQERQAACLEEVDCGEAVCKAPHVDEDDRADGAAHQVVPHEPEPALPGGAEQVQHQIL